MNTDDKMEIGRLSGVPVRIDMALVLVVLTAVLPLLEGHGAHGPSMAVLAGAGLVLSILLRELARLITARRLGLEPSSIELGGLAGRCRLQASQTSMEVRTAMVVAGLATSAALWVIFSTFWRETAALAAASTAPGFAAGLESLAQVFWFLAQANLFIFAFSLLPAYPLDGGRALGALAAPHLGDRTARNLIAWSGFGVAGLTAVAAYFLGPVMLLLAALVMLESVAATAAHPPHRRSP